MKASNLRIKRHFSLIPHSPQQVEIRSGVWNPTSYQINDDSSTGKLYGILKDLDGNYAPQEIAKRHQISRAEVEGVLDHLQQLDVLETTASSWLDCHTENLPLQGGAIDLEKNILIIGDSKASYEIQRILVNNAKQKPIETFGLEEPLIKKLKDNDQWLFDGFLLQEIIEAYSWWQDYFIVLALTQNDPVLVMRLNQINQALGIPWIHGVIDGPFIFIGPTFTGKNGPCYHCFEKRVSMNLREYASYQRYKDSMIKQSSHRNLRDAVNPVLVNLLAAHLSMEILNYQLTKSCFTKGKVLSIYLPTMEICFNDVLRLSGCHVCGAVPQRDDHQLYFDYQTLLEDV
ncbi:MAG: TOMM precursor leader peptide-binding protein [Gammaproteobacteria bacterium]